MQMTNKMLQDANVTIDEWKRRIIVKVLILFSTFYFSRLLRMWKPRKILSLSLILLSISRGFITTILFYTVTHLATTYALSLTTFDKLCEKQRPSGFSDR